MWDSPHNKASLSPEMGRYIPSKSIPGEVNTGKTFELPTKYGPIYTSDMSVSYNMVITPKWNERAHLQHL